jgi:hypothetical protein
LIVAKVGLQSKPPASRKGKPFKTFIEVMRHIVENEGFIGLFKGIGAQILKGLLVQGILMMIKERYLTASKSPTSIHFLTCSRMELMFILLFRQVRAQKLQKIADHAIENSKRVLPVVSSEPFRALSSTV